MSLNCAHLVFSMKDLINKNKKKIKMSVLLSFVIAIFFLFLVNMQIINLPCTVQYLNPWQHFFKCNLFYSYNAVILFIVSFVTIFFFLRFTQLVKN